MVQASDWNSSRWGVLKISKWEKILGRTWTSLSWLRNASVSHQKSWRKWLGRATDPDAWMDDVKCSVFPYPKGLKKKKNLHIKSTPAANHFLVTRKLHPTSVHNVHVWVTLQPNSQATPDVTSAAELTKHTCLGVFSTPGVTAGRFTYSPSLSQMARPTRNSTSDPSKKTESQIFSTVGAGRQVANMVRNHCIVKTLVSGGS